MVQDDESGLGKETTFTTPEEIAGFLALKHANGMSFKQVLDLHTWILTRIGRDYVKIWGTDHEGKPHTEFSRKHYQTLQEGAYFALDYLEDDDEWYHFEPKDEL